MSETVMAPEKLSLRELLAARCEEFQVLLDGYGAANPKLFGPVARGTASAGSRIDILVEMDPAEGDLLMRASGLLAETRALFGCDDIDVFPLQLLKRPVSASVPPRRCVGALLPTDGADPKLVRLRNVVEFRFNN
ncbi:nucleotidyltransferase family protein [Luteococcus sp.]|uniref:nucleotidyltransferase family protein n=1 Tax=Luteococcus sp. TaxID=1969402 RepID=UPI0037369C31